MKHLRKIAAVVAGLCASALSAQAEPSATAMAKFAYVSGKKWACEADIASDRFNEGRVHVRGLVLVTIGADLRVNGMSGVGFTASGQTFSKVVEARGYAYYDGSYGDGFVLDDFTVSREDSLPYGMTWGETDFDSYTIVPTGWASEPYELHLKSVGKDASVVTTVCHLHNG